MKGKKLNNKTVIKELEDMIENDDEIRRHKLEIEMIKREQKKQLESYLKKEISTF